MFEPDQGVWIFKGRLRPGNAICGRWRISGASDDIDHGIFSLVKIFGEGIE